MHVSQTPTSSLAGKGSPRHSSDLGLRTRSGWEQGGEWVFGEWQEPLFFVNVFGAHTMVLRDYTWQTQGTL